MIKTFLIIGFSGLIGMTMLIGLGNTTIPLCLAFALAYLSYPVIRYFEKRGIKRHYAVISVFLFSTGAISLMIFLGLPVLIEDFRQFFEELPQTSLVVVEKVQLFAQNFGLVLDISKQGLKEWLSEHASSISGDFMKSTSMFIKKILSNFMALILIILNFLLIPIFYFHLVSSYESISKLGNELIPLPWRVKVGQYAILCNTVLNGYIRGQMLVVMILAVLYGTGFWLIGLRFGMLIGIVTGLLSIIPFVGSLFGFSMAIVFALANFTDYKVIAGVVAVFAIVQGLEGLFITPKLVGDKVGLGVLATMLSLIIGGNLFGLAGMIIAIPLAAILKKILLDLKEQYLTLPFYKGES